MRALQTAFAALFMLAVAFLPGSGKAQISGDASPDAAQRALRDASRSLDLQTRLPDATVKAEPENYRRSENASRGLRISADFARVLLVLAIIGILAVVIYHLRDNLWSLSRSRKLTRAEEAETTPVETVARMEKAQVEADDLARAGDFGEAMHVLLLQSLSEMRRRLSISIAVSLTSREILRAVGLPLRAEEALASIIHWVEISYFGGHRPSAEEYHACRASFEQLTDALRTQGGA